MWRYEARYSRPATSALQTSRGTGRGDCWRGPFETEVRGAVQPHAISPSRLSAALNLQQAVNCRHCMLARNLRAASPEHKGKEAS